uniref:Glyco_transf_7C domain-containing protein n=1 Tax=Macrostomum lignano TaxID=282301 RepID=A0A1I8FQH6_9PLAT
GNSSRDAESHWIPPWASDPITGGHHAPSDCSPGKSVLILVPYRQREQHLAALLRLPAPDSAAAAALLQHCGWRSSPLPPWLALTEILSYINEDPRLLRKAFDSFVALIGVVFHDVDLLPTNPFVPYNCPAYPGTSVCPLTSSATLSPTSSWGGVLAMPVRHFLKVNGYSNLFWGWGGEDDDMEARIRSVGLLVTRPNPRLARYRMIRHQARKEILNEVRYKLLYLSSKRYRLDGLNSLSYSLVASESRPLYTHFLIDLGQPPRSSSFY